MTEINWFKFEKKDLDFPFYRKNPYIPKWGWIVLFFALPLGLLFSASYKAHITFLSCVVLIVPVLYFLKWDYTAIFQKPTTKEIGLALALFAGYIIYALIVSSALHYFGITPPTLIEESDVSLNILPSFIFSIMGEEFLKFIPFIFFMRVAYKFSNNRKLSAILSMLIVMSYFAFLHAIDFNLFMFTFFIQGLGSIFEFYGYFKTKNLLIPYTTHLATDIFILAIGLMGL